MRTDRELLEIAGVKGTPRYDDRDVFLGFVDDEGKLFNPFTNPNDARAFCEYVSDIRKTVSEAVTALVKLTYNSPDPNVLRVAGGYAVELSRLLDLR